MIEQFLGHEIDYWIALQERAERLNVPKLIQEIAELYGKVQFYESRIEEMVKIKDGIHK